MREKLPRFFLLSSLSFVFFTAVFHTIANAQEVVVPTPTVFQQAEKANTAPTPTIYMALPATQTNVTEITPLSPTPTIYMAPQQQGVGNTAKLPAKPTATPTSIPPTATPTPTVTPTPSPMPTSQPTTATDINSLFTQYASSYNVSVDELRKIASCESGFNTNSDTGTYAGMFQFSASTWAAIRGSMGLDPNPDLRKNAEEAIRTTAFMLSRGEENAWPNCH